MEIKVDLESLYATLDVIVSYLIDGVGIFMLFIMGFLFSLLLL